MVVTAEKRAQKLADVPNSVSVLTQEQLESANATQLADYAGYIPGLIASSGGTPGQEQLVIRGVTTGDRSSATVGIYLDDAPYGSSSSGARGGAFALDLFPYDLDRIEVLRGPQGTLYGASTIGGLLKYVTKSPDLSRFEARAGADVSLTSHAGDPGWGIRASANVPLVEDELGVRASFLHQDSPASSITRSPRGRTRTRIPRMVPGSPYCGCRSIRCPYKLTGTFQHIHADAPNTVRLDPFGGAPIYGPLSYDRLVPEPFDQKIQFYTAALDWDLGWASLTSVSSYSHIKTTQDQDVTPYYVPVFPLISGGAITDGLATFQLGLDFEKYTEEFRLASPDGGDFQWLIGGLRDL